VSTNHIALRTNKGSRAPSVVVVGGGLAGIAAAVKLSNWGVSTTLIETRKRLGGRATSFVDPKTGQTLDNCQHVLMGCCTNLIDLYRRLGVADRIQWHNHLYFADDQGTIDRLEADDLPAPLHMTRSLMSFKLFSVVEKIAISRGIFAILRLGPGRREQLHEMSFAKWLANHRQPPGAIKKFWSVIVTSALNEKLDAVNAAYAIQVFQDGFLANDRAYVMGLPMVPLVNLYETAQQVILDAGGEVSLSSSADSFVFDGHRITSIQLADGREIEADAFISALPYDRLEKICSGAMCQVDARLQKLGNFHASPIIGIHLWFDTPKERPLMRLPHVILTKGPLQWIFNKGYDPQLGGQHLHGVISAAYELVDTPAEKIIDLAVTQIRSVMKRLSNAADARLLHGRVIKEKRATFSLSPGVDRLRATTDGKIGNLFLAGDWCQTGWPATMEGATRSGYLAAAAAADELHLESCQTGGGLGQPLVADLPPAMLYQLSCLKS